MPAHSHRVDPALPASAGLGLKPQHYREILDSGPALGFFEVHAENYMGDGGPPHRYLEAIRARYPLSLHGVGLSLGGEGPLDRDHLDRLRRLIRRYEPGRFSEHLAWSTHRQGFLNDLLPLPYTERTLARVCDHVDETQDRLGRQMLLENPSTYLRFAESCIGEAEFLAEIARCTGCGLLLDLNNVQVSASNHGYDPLAYLRSFPLAAVEQIHLAGFTEISDASGAPLLIDAHGSRVSPLVWGLYAWVLERRGSLPTLIEWDNEVPEWPLLLREARRADSMMVENSRVGIAV